MSTHLVSYADTDAGGVLHHAKYIELAEMGRHWWLKGRDLSFSGLNREHRLSLVVHDIVAKYKSSIYLEDEINIITRLNGIDRKGLEWLTHIKKKDDLSFTMTTTMVCLNAITRSIVSVPSFLISRLEPEVGTT